MGDWDNHCNYLFYLSTLSISPLKNFMKRAVAVPWSSSSVDGMYHSYISLLVGSPLLSNPAGWPTEFGELRAGAEKGISLVSSLFQAHEWACFTGDRNSELRAGPQGNYLRLAPYQPCLSQMGRVKPSQQQSSPNGDNMCVKDMQSLVLGLWLEKQLKKQHPTTCPWTGTAWLSPS